MAKQKAKTKVEGSDSVSTRNEALLKRFDVLERRVGALIDAISKSRNVKDI